MDDIYIPSNRETRKIPRKSKFWCDRCDRSFLPNNVRCKICGMIHRDSSYKYSKSQNKRGE
jgi:hypothetical protein